MQWLGYPLNKLDDVLEKVLTPDRAEAEDGSENVTSAEPALSLDASNSAEVNSLKTSSVDDEAEARNHPSRKLSETEDDSRPEKLQRLSPSAAEPPSPPPIERRQSAEDDVQDKSAALQSSKAPQHDRVNRTAPSKPPLSAGSLPSRPATAAMPGSIRRTATPGSMRTGTPGTASTPGSIKRAPTSTPGSIRRTPASTPGSIRRTPASSTTTPGSIRRIPRQQTTSVRKEATTMMTTPSRVPGMAVRRTRTPSSRRSPSSSSSASSTQEEEKKSGTIRSPSPLAGTTALRPSAAAVSNDETAATTPLYEQARLSTNKQQQFFFPDNTTAATTDKKQQLDSLQPPIPVPNESREIMEGSDVAHRQASSPAFSSSHRSSSNSSTEMQVIDLHSETGEEEYVPPPASARPLLDNGNKMSSHDLREEQAILRISSSLENPSEETGLTRQETATDEVEAPSSVKADSDHAAARTQEHDGSLHRGRAESDDKFPDVVEDDESSISLGAARSSSSSVPQQVELRSQFDDAAEQQRSEWDDEETGERFDSAEQQSFDPRMNCLGVVHVRVLRAKRLSCSVGSAVQAIVSLQPWKGRVRTEKAKSFFVGEKHGVCVQWEEDDGDESSTITMIHAYSDEESPVPTIQSLMINPSIPKRLWLAPTVDGDGDHSESPMIQIEALFEPDSASEHPEEELLPLVEAPVQPAVSISTAPVQVVEVESENSLERSDLESALPDTSSTRNKASARYLMKQAQRSQSNLSYYSTSSRKSETKPPPTKYHLLRNITYWSPAVCGVCKRSIASGVRKRKAFHCEECNLDCCADCQVQVDVQLPCGSDEARAAVAESIQSKLTVDNILNVVAPVDGSTERHVTAPSSPAVRRSSSFTASAKATTKLEGQPLDGDAGIGALKVNFFRAHIFEDQFPAETTSLDITSGKVSGSTRVGDYYVRVTSTDSKKTSRTRTIQNTGKPSFESGEFQFNIPHYGTEFRIEVVDGATDKPVGVTLLTTQGLLQEQRDFMVEKRGVRLLSFRHRPSRFEGKRRLLLELRTGVKGGFSSDFFVSEKRTSESKAQPGAVVGWIELLAGLEENVDSLYGERPYSCPSRPPGDLDMHMFQVHISRVGSLVSDIRDAFSTYVYIVSWKNPAVTGLALILFLLVSLRSNPAYLGSAPIFILLCYMLYLAARRYLGNPRKRFVQREIEAQRKAEKVSVNYTLHRPVGLLSVKVPRGRNIRSPELGLPGKVCCRAYWDPTRLATDKQKKADVALDKASSASHEIGQTKSIYNLNPVWDAMEESNEAKRLKLVLLNDGNFFGDSSERSSKQGVEFPVLHPFVVGNDEEPILEPWSSSHGALVIEVKFHDVLSVLPGSEYALGEVCIPFTQIYKKGSVEGWFHVLEVGSTRSVSVSKDSAEEPSSSFDAQIFVSVRWSPPNEGGNRFQETVREASVVIQEEMERSAIMTEQTFDIVGSSIGAFNRFRGLSGNLLVVQNTLGFVLNLVESIRNAFNFTDPYKSSVLFAALFLLWLFLVLVPTRVIIIAGGLAQFGITFVARFGYLFRSKAKKVPPKDDAEKTEELPNPFVVWITNALRGLPTEEDLRKTYFWESRRLGAQERDAYTEQKRRSRLKRLWRAQWYSTAKILSQDGDGEQFRWEPVFSMIQGHRFLWWESTADFDNGEAPLGRIFLAGHAGLATPSPLELRSIDSDHLPRIVSIFGRGVDKQEKVTILAPTMEVKEAFESAVIAASSKKAD